MSRNALALVRDAPVLGPGILQRWSRDTIPRVRDTPALESALGQGCSVPRAKDAPSLGSREILCPWVQGCSGPGVRVTLCDEEPKSGHHAHARGARHQCTPSTSDVGLDTVPIPPYFPWEQRQTPPIPSPEGHLVSPHAGHPPPTQPRRDQGKHYDRVNQSQASSPTASSNKHASL